MTSFRRIPRNDAQRYREILRYAFAPQQGPLESSSEEEWPPELFDPYGLYDEGVLRSTCKLYSLDARLSGGYEPIGGLGAVATPPEDRRQGYVRELCRHVLSTFEERGARLVVLWPFETAFYAKFGWATANYRARYECPPAALPTYRTDDQMIPLAPGECEQLREAEHAHAQQLSLRRSPEWWRERTLTNWTGGTQPYIYAAERDGDVVGFLTYTVDDDTLAVETMATADETATRTLLSFLGTHGAQIEHVVFTRPEGWNLLDRVDEPQRVEQTIQPGPMVRLPSVSALDGLPWPDTGLDCSVTVTDPLSDEQTTARIETTVDGLRVTDAGDSTAAFSTDIGTLSQLVVGTHGVERARRLDTLTVYDETVLDRLAATFEAREVFLNEFF